VTGGAQQPWVSTSPIRGSFYFASAPASGALAAANEPESTVPKQQNGAAITPHGNTDALKSEPSNHVDTALSVAEPNPQPADPGKARAIYNLALTYELGEGIAKDQTEAARLYRQAADLGDDDAMDNLGDGTRKRLILGMTLP
jgi:TPR repeat protein